MGILSFILSPLEDIVKGLTAPVEAIGKIFGVLIKTVEGIIEMIEGLIKDIASLFDISSIEEIFMKPFKTVVLLAISSVEKLFDLIKDDVPTFGGYKDLIIAPFKEVYDVIGDFMASVKQDLEKIALEIKHYAGDIGTEVFSEVRKLLIHIESIPSHLLQITQKIKNSMSVESKRLISVVPEFTARVVSAPLSMAKHITTDISADVQKYDDVYQSLEKRFKNEHAIVDLFILLMVFALVAFTGGLFYITKSFTMVSSIIMIVVAAFLVFIVFEVLRKFT